jgi:hypothetical protein
MVMAVLPQHSISGGAAYLAVLHQRIEMAFLDWRLDSTLSPERNGGDAPHRKMR